MPNCESQKGAKRSKKKKNRGRKKPVKNRHRPPQARKGGGRKNLARIMGAKCLEQEGLLKNLGRREKKKETPLKARINRKR